MLSVDEFGIKDVGTYVCISGNTTNAKFHVVNKEYERMSQDQPMNDKDSHLTRGSVVNTGKRAHQLLSSVCETADRATITLCIISRSTR